MLERLQSVAESLPVPLKWIAIPLVVVGVVLVAVRRFTGGEPEAETE